VTGSGNTPLTPPADYNALIDAVHDLAVDYGVVDSSIGAGGNSLSDNSKSWGVNIHTNRIVKIIGGTGKGQRAFISGNSANSLTIRTNWAKAISPGDKYVILNADFAQVLRDVLGSGANISATNPLQVFDPKVWGSVSGLVLAGYVTAVPGANQFTISTLAGLGDTRFTAAIPYSAYVLWDAGGAAAAPQGEQQRITAYVSATGTFTAGAFTAAVAVGDYVAIVHPAIIEMMKLIVLADGVGNFPDSVVDGSIISKMLSSVAGGDTSSYDETTDSLEAISDKVSGIQPPMDFYGLPQRLVTVDDVVGDIALPDIVVADLPDESTVVRAIGIILFRKVTNNNAGANALDGAQELQIRDNAPGAWTDLLNFVDDMFTFTVAEESNGHVVFGVIDVSGVVVGNGTYNVQWAQALADAASLLFEEVQVGLRIWYRM